MNGAQRTKWVCERAREAGFDLCGVAPVEGLGELDFFPQWLARGYAGDMNYLRDPRRGDPRLVLDGARSLIVVALNYNSPQPYSTKVVDGAESEDKRARGWISRYAWGDDYHDVIGMKLNILLADMRKEFTEPFEARAYVDTGPIIERVAAKYAGLGWLAKNTFLINQQLGSWLFLGVIITTLALDPTLSDGAAPLPDLCGSCTRCLDACPTQAFPEPYVLDGRRCISYLTIELRGAIPEELRAGMGNAVIGCDICQDVCPWNRKAPVTSLREFQPRLSATQVPDPTGTNAEQHLLFHPELEWLASLQQQEFSAIFRKSAVKRAKWRGLVRNACVALGNSGLGPQSAEYPRVVELLKNLAAGEDGIIAGHAQWALVRLYDTVSPAPENTTTHRG
jgi:epoxyqueuosine reductase